MSEIAPVGSPNTDGPPAVPALSVRLREATAAAHERIELGLNLFGPDFSVDRYARLLERWHGFERMWQDVAAESLAGVAGADFVARRRKLPLLRADLLACGRRAESIDALPVVPRDALPWHTAAGALGVLYVAEGSTLGGQYVAKTLRTALGPARESAVAYFSSYGPDVGVRWRETKRLLDATPDAEAQLVIAGANDTFDFLTRWLSER